MKKKLRYADTEVSLDDEQSDEISSIMSFIQNNHAEDLEELFVEGMSYSCHLLVIMFMWIDK